ncbi:peptidylprolyl isomerase [Arsenicicoccus sp. oral taxon 190]|uniref:peptidylprolyl isomerase n=1 Tax=Arsenicicoccus sp. oral taxon 190 TaxID=1658671 RepID=UPI00067A3B91|nr:peptidylprolyl isomerase [Arsenicicoccus sp. oral taxon 190]AKT52607.1 peptidylprolyl isomerase [Arsenicicoccus sp. oral taxon 190]
MNWTLHTNHGDITLTLFPEAAPTTVAKITGLAKEGYYDGLTFHRIIPGFMIQGGCPQGTGTGQPDKPGFPFDDEISPDKDFTKPYMLAMANAGKRMGRGTNGSQFFITVGATTWLQGKHTIFGECADQSSRDVVDKIAAVSTGAMDKPVEPVVIESTTVSE